MRVNVRSDRSLEEKKTLMIDRLNGVISEKNKLLFPSVSGQDFVYFSKYQEAQRLLGGSQSGVAFLAAEAQQRGVSVIQLAGEVIAKHEETQTALAENEQSRIRIKALVDAAQTDADLELARKEIHALETGV